MAAFAPVPKYADTCQRRTQNEVSEPIMLSGRILPMTGFAQMLKCEMDDE